MTIRSLLALALVSLTSCDEPTPLPLGGGNALVVDADATCPDAYPNRHPAGEHVICGDEGFSVAATTRVACADAGIDCDALYGCTPMPLSACEATRTTADCGGEGPPTFACEPGHAGAGCRWYVRGCLADGAIASPCPSDDLCCVGQNAGAPPDTATFAPFASDVGGSFGSANANYAAGLFTSRFGTAPIGLDDDFTFAVTATDPPSATGVVVTCPNPTLDPFCAWEPKQSFSNGASDFGVSASMGFGTSGYTVEIRTVLGVEKARVCSFSVTDLAVTTCTTDAPPARGRCFSDGLVELGTSRIRVTVPTGEGDVILELPR